jgi:hypothetical protein
MSDEVIGKHNLTECRRTEGVYIIESLAANGHCDSDDRGPSGLKVCLEERPERSYWIYGITNYDDKKIRAPPGLEYLNNTNSFHGIWLSDVVRSSLYWDEVREPSQLQPEWEGGSMSSSDSSSESSSDSDSDSDAEMMPPENMTIPENITLLLDYGNVPGVFRIPICRSWFGEAISTIKSKDKVNGPCLCDSMDPDRASHWSQANNWTTAYTKKFVKDGGFYNFNNYGKICGSKCDKSGSWKSQLHLEEDEKPAKHMKHAWGRSCEAKGWKKHELGEPQLTTSESASSSTAPSTSATDEPLPLALEPLLSPSTTRQPIVQATTELVAHTTRYPKNTPKNITRQGECNGPYCIVDTVYKVVEQHFGYTIDSSVPENDYSCAAGDDWCVEQSAHDLCEYFDDEDELKEEEEFGYEDGEDENEEVGEDEDEYADFIQEDELPDSEAQKNKQPTPEEDEAMKLFRGEIELANRRMPCFCGGNGTAGQHGIQCFDKGVTTKTTTVKGRMKQTYTPGKSATGTPTNASGAGAGAKDDQVVTITRSRTAESGSPSRVFTSYVTYKPTNVLTVYETYKRDVTLQVASELSSIAIPTEVPVFLPSSFASFASYSTATVG